VDRGHAQAGLRGAGCAVARMHARLLVLAPAPVQQHQHAVGKRGGDLLPQAELGGSLALAQQGDPLAQIAAQLADVEHSRGGGPRRMVRGAAGARQVHHQGRGVARIGGLTPDRDLARPALEPHGNELDLTRRELSRMERSRSSTCA